MRVSGEYYLCHVGFLQGRGFIDITPSVGATGIVVNEEQAAVWCPSDVQASLVFLYKLIEKLR
jgi:hypothetical protein